MTALHITCHQTWPHSVYEMFNYGADPNILDDERRTPMMYTNKQKVAVEVVKELAKLKFENQYVCPENLDWIGQNHILEETFKGCLEELQKMKNHVLWKNVSLYNVLKRDYDRTKKLTFYTKNVNFIKAFNTGWDRESLLNYNEHLDDIFEDALQIRDFLQSEEEKMIIIFKDFLPEVVVRKLSYFVNEHILFE